MNPQTIDSKKPAARLDISKFTEFAESIGVLGIKISQNNQLIASWQCDEECRRNIYSATKSFTSCAVGFAIQEGLLSLDEKLTEAFHDDLPPVIDHHLEAACVRDLLTMRLGQASPHLMGAQRPL